MSASRPLSSFLSVRGAILCAALLLLAVPAARSAEPTAAPGGRDGIVVADPKAAGNSAEYIAISPEAFVDALIPLVEWRTSQGLEARIVTVEAIEKAFPGEAPLRDRIRGFVRHASTEWKEPRPRFLLLATDVDVRAKGVPAIPTFIVPAPSVGTCASDNPYGCPGESRIPTLAVGRFPARDAAELRGFVERTIAYERDLAPGKWRRQFAFIAGEGRFGPVIDSVLESVFTKIVSEMIPYDFDVDLTYHSPASPYFYPPSRFSKRVVERMNEGALVYTYVGHGSKRSFDRSILRVDDVDDVACESGSPVVVVLACETGHFDDVQADCIGEAIFRRPDGPVGFLGSSRDSQPYANGLLGFGMVLELFSEGGPKTFGEIIVRAKERMVSDPDNPDRPQFDAMATMFLTPQEMESQRVEHLALYNLFGDPALRLAYPEGKCEVDAPAEAPAGAAVTVTGRAEGIASGEATVSIEVGRKTWVGELESAAAAEGKSGREAVIIRNHETANRKAIVVREVRLEDGAFEVELPLPADAPVGACHVKVYVEGQKIIAVGSRPITIRPRAKSEF